MNGVPCYGTHRNCCLKEFGHGDETNVDECIANGNGPFTFPSDDGPSATRIRGRTANDGASRHSGVRVRADVDHLIPDDENDGTSHHSGLRIKET